MCLLWSHRRETIQDDGQTLCTLTPPAVLPRPLPGVTQSDPVSVPANATHRQVGEAFYLVNSTGYFSEEPA